MRCCRRLPDGRGRGADRDRGGRRRRGHGRRGRDHLPAGRGLGDDLQGGGRLGGVPYRRRGRARRTASTSGSTAGTAIEQAGGYDEGMLRAEDWDLNYRIRARGGQIWFTPELRVTYRPRASVRTLGSQYFHYGRWRRVVIREHPETASFRYLAPPAAAGLVALGLAAGVAGLAAIRGRGARWRALAGRRIRDPRHLPGRDHRRRDRARPAPARGRADPGAAGPRRHAHVLGDRLPHQPAKAAPVRRS